MKIITDEMLNNYIDGLLSGPELKEVEEAVKNDPELLEKLRALHFVDRELKLMEAAPAPEKITEKVMNAVSVTKKKRINVFFISSVSFIATLFAATLGAIIFFSNKGVESGSESFNVITNVNKYFSLDFSFLKNFTASNNLMITIGGLSFILLVFFYFILNSHKAFKDELKRYTM